VQRRLVLAYAVVLLAGAAVAGGTALVVFGGNGGAGGCGAVGSSSAEAAQAVAESFIRDVLVRAKPSCSHELGTSKLRLGGVPLFKTRYPLVAYRHARPDSPRTQAVYVVARPPDGGLQFDAQNVPLTILSVGLAAPDAGEAGYRLTLRLDRGRWRVDVVRRVAV
jgi:hypothetical protein